jgi:uncharacterized protein Usg
LLQIKFSLHKERGILRRRAEVQRRWKNLSGALAANIELHVPDKLGCGLWVFDLAPELFRQNSAVTSFTVAEVEGSICSVRILSPRLQAHNIVGGLQELKA